MIDLSIEDSQAQEFLRAKVRRVVDARAPLERFRLYVVSRIKLQFRALRKGGRFRGVYWRDLKGRPGIRQTRGGNPVRGVSTRGSAFGGYRQGVYSDVATHKIHGGVRTGGRWTLGALRPSGKRVTFASAVMQDTGTLLRKAGQWVRYRSLNEIWFGTNLKYAARQNATRPFMFFELPRDLNQARKICLEHFNK